MSDSSTLKKLPLPLSPAQANQAIAVARHPVAIAVVASLGVHGLLWFGLPYLTAAEPPKKDPQQAVDVIELSPLEQARLPQSILEQALTPSRQTGKTDQKAAASANVPVNPGDPAISDAVPYYSVPNLWGSATSGYSGTYGSSTYGSGTYDSGAYDNRTADSRTDRKTETSSDRKTTKSDTKTNESKTEDPQKNNQEADTNKKTESQNQTNEDKDGISKQAKDLQGEQQTTSPKTSGQELLALREKYAYDPNDPNLSNDAALQSMTKFSEENGIDINDWSKVKDLEVLLPGDACKVKADLGAALTQPLSVGAIVQPDGSLSKVVLFGSSGSKGLNQLAVDYLKKQEFPASDKNNFLRFRVKFDAESSNCANASGESAPS